MKLILFAEVDKFINDLEKPTQAKWTRHLVLLSNNGLRLGMPHARRLDERLYELRIRGKQEVRAFYVFVGDNVYILHAFVKKTQKIPKREVDLAVKRLQSLT